jgi:hypothetical protein
MPQLVRVASLMQPPMLLGDVTPPGLSAATATSIGPDRATPGVTTDENDGTLYFVLVPNGDVPSAAQIKAGQQSSGAAAIGSGNVAVVSTGAKTFTAVTGLTPSTAYDIWYLQRDLAGNDSTAVKYDLTTAAIGLSNGATVVTPTTITITADSDYTLVGAVYGVEYSIGVGAPYAFSQSVAGAVTNQSIALTIADIGAVPGDTVNLRCYYNLDVLNPANDPNNPRVYDGTFVVVLTASESLSLVTLGYGSFSKINRVITLGMQ